MNEYFTDRELSERYKIHRTSLWRWVRQGYFPKPIKLSSGCSRWLKATIEEWEKLREFSECRD